MILNRTLTRAFRRCKMVSFEHVAGVTQLVECDLAKVDVAGSNPVSRSNLPLEPRLLPPSGGMPHPSLLLWRFQTR